MSAPAFTIVTISFNQAAFLERAILSVLDQKGADFEYIVIDGGSTDGSRDIIYGHKDRIDRIIFEPDQGPADALNKGLAAARGKYFYYLNSDDELSPSVLLKVARMLEQRPKIDVLYGNGAMIDERGGYIRSLVSSKRFTPKSYAYGAAVILQQSAFIRTSSLREIGGFNVRNRTCWDGETFVRMAIAGAKFERIWENWGRFRVHGNSITGSGRLNSSYREDNRRLFSLVLNRSPSRIDRLIRVFAIAFDRLSDLERMRAAVARSMQSIRRVMR